jgi:hypothetical protein
MKIHIVFAANIEPCDNAGRHYMQIDLTAWRGAIKSAILTFGVWVVHRPERDTFTLSKLTLYLATCKMAFELFHRFLLIRSRHLTPLFRTEEGG